MVKERLCEPSAGMMRGMCCAPEILKPAVTAFTKWMVQVEELKLGMVNVS